MNLQRREEIRELIAEIARYEELGATLDLESKARDAITELLAHIDTLEQTAAERVIARGAAVKPHTFGGIVNQVRDIASQYAGTEQLRERIAHALAPHFERDAGPTPDYTGEGSAWVPPAEAWAVVVPEQGSIYAALLANRDRLRSELDAIAKERSGPHCLRCRNAAVCSTRDDDRSVPLCVADPECSMPLWEPVTLADVQAVVSEIDAARAELSCLRDALVELCDSKLSSRDREDAIARGLAALRANQGGSAT